MDTLEKAADVRSVVRVEDAATFARDGFFIPDRGLDHETTAKLRDAVERVFAANPGWHDLLRQPHIPKRDGQKEGVTGGEGIFPLALHPTIIDAARKVIGPDLILWGAEIFAKPAAVGKATPWHQDCYNPVIKPGPGQAFPRSVMIWIAVDDVDTGNGCLRFIPGSGRTGPIDHQQLKRTNALLDFEVDDTSFPVHTAVDAILPAGHFSMHDSLVLHGANANVSARRRAGITFHYMNAADGYDRSFGSAIGTGAAGTPAPLAERPIWLVLGKNRNPVNDFRIGHQNLEDLDRLAEATRVRLSALLD